MSDRSDVLMLHGVVTDCADCGGERLFVPTDDPGAPGEFCCTGCDAAVFLMTVVDAALRSSTRVA